MYLDMKTAFSHALISAMLQVYTAAQCQNGGYYVGTGCICPNAFYGPMCNFIKDSIPTVKFSEYAVNVKLKATNRNFTENLTAKMTKEYKDFEKDFKTKMEPIYSKLPGYTDVNIQKLSQGSVIVDHEVIAKIKYRQNASVTQKYQKLIQHVKMKLGELKEQRCTNGGSALCIDEESVEITGIPPLSENELCKAMVPYGFGEFYSAILTSEGLNCVSLCNPKSPKYLNCHEGRCQLSRAGPECFGRKLGLSIRWVIALLLIIFLGIVIWKLKKTLTLCDKPFFSYVKLV
ncbi:mucin-17-like [Mixophyes fleayi]|uniref:mucin-17-like n=1 Tax=Mixophyes fleayi TaxID=3061075 RepID=UPI003F4D8075